MQVQLPDPLVVVVQRVPTTPSLTVTTLPGSEVPLKLGVLSLVKLPSTKVRITGATGAVVSTFKLNVVEGELVFPAASVEVAVML